MLYRWNAYEYIENCNHIFYWKYGIKYFGLLQIFARYCSLNKPLELNVTHQKFIMKFQNSINEEREVNQSL